MKTEYKNTINLTSGPDPKERRENLHKAIVQDGDFVPYDLTYEDIDRAFKKWIEDISVVKDGKELPTMALFSNQRFSEYMQTWKFTDDDNNILLNFKTISREQTPVHGTMNNGYYSIPGDPYYLIKRVKTLDEAGRKYYIDYKMKEPMAIDISYKVSVVSNSIVTINEFSEKLNMKFRGLQAVISPKNHLMSMILEGSTDESEYNISDRQFFSQTFNIKVKGYIISKDDFKVEEVPSVLITCIEGDGTGKRPDVEIEDIDCGDGKDPYEKKRINLSITFKVGDDDKVRFVIDTDMTLTGYRSDNIKDHLTRIYIDGTRHEGPVEGLRFHEGDEITVKMVRKRRMRDSVLIFEGESENDMVFESDIPEDMAHETIEVS